MPIRGRLLPPQVVELEASASHRQSNKPLDLLGGGLGVSSSLWLAL